MANVSCNLFCRTTKIARRADWGEHVTLRFPLRNRCTAVSLDFTQLALLFDPNSTSSDVIELRIKACGQSTFFIKITSWLGILYLDHLHNFPITLSFIDPQFRFRGDLQHLHGWSTGKKNEQQNSSCFRCRPISRASKTTKIGFLVGKRLLRRLFPTLKKKTATGYH